MQYEFDPREIPANFSTGYVPQGSTTPNEYPQSIYGTEVSEVNTALRSLVVGFAKTATLNDSTLAQAYRANYVTPKHLETLLRATVAGLVNFARIIVMRTASDMDRPYSGQAATTNLFWANQGDFEPALRNIYLAGIKVV